MTHRYLLKYHAIYYQRIQSLKEQVKGLKARLPEAEYAQHEIVKFAARVRQADQDIIPQDPDRPDYRLKGALRKYRRYKRGLQRYRLFFCFSNRPPIILYLYLNDEKHLRKEGDKNDPYVEFTRLVDKGEVSHNLSADSIQRWIRNRR
jgi:toxin YhaV